MPVATNDGVALRYAVAGGGETVAFVGDVGYGPWQWAWQQPAVAGPAEALVLALRGTGDSDAPPGPYDVDALAGDLEAVLSARGARRAHLVGAGLGAMVALRHARRYGRARSLVLLGGAAEGAAVDVDALRALHPPPDDEAALRRSLSGALSPAFREARPDLVDRVVAWRREEDARPPVVSAHVAALREFSAGPLHEVTVPALVGHGVDDPVVDPSAGEALAEGLPRGRYLPVEGRRLCHVERASAVNDELVGFVEERTDERG